MDDEKNIEKWVEEFPSSITVCDEQGTVIAMNSASRANFAGRGGKALIGTSLFDCHSEHSNKIIKKMLQEEFAQTYITETKDKKRLVHQSPWYNKGVFAGLVETIIELPGEIEKRKKG